jgi:predicted enzyme related to lactoylglutathione lyase
MGSTEHLFAGIPVADLERLIPWYERLFGRTPDRLVGDFEAVWQLTETSSVYVVRDAKRAGWALLTLIVEDLEAVISSLEERGVAGVRTDTIPGVGRKAEVTDPEGNRVTFAALG